MKKTYIIAEAGVNHNGDIKLAKKMIDVAVEAGVDAVKFQTYKTDKIVTKKVEQAEYQRENMKRIISQYDMLKQLELTDDNFRELYQYCKEQEIIFLSTAFDGESAEMLKSLGMTIIKIPSGEITNAPLLKRLAKLNLPIILSTGMAMVSEIQDAVNLIKKYNQDITLLQCNSDYPTKMGDVNLNAMTMLKELFQLPVGYSDHTTGIEVPTAAVALGATVIEKHFTLDKNMEGPDHAASLEPNELKAMVKAIRNVEKALGSGLKEPTLSELKNKEVVRKSIVAKRYICKGQIFTNENITVKRPGKGISPMKWDKVIGEKAKRDFYEDELIEI